MQAFIGWWMVKSGLSGEPSVSQYRLATHLGMAFIILGVLVWTLLDLVVGVGPSTTNTIVLHAKLVCGLILTTILAGALVAGLNAGLIYNMFPLMGGKVVPEDYLAMKLAGKDPRIF